MPRLYQKYIGHDNNRDFYANTQAETKNMNRVMYREWFPQIVYNHHQTGPPGTVLFCPPFRDPFNYNIDPLVINGIDAVGAAMMQRFLAEGKPGATVRSGCAVLDVVQRRPAHHLLLPQHDRPAYRNHRQSDAHADSVHPRQAVAQGRLPGARSRRRRGTSGSRSTTP